MPPAKLMPVERTVISTSGGPPAGALRNMMMVAAGMPCGEESVLITGRMARRQALAKRFGGFLPVWRGVSECFTDRPRPCACAERKMPELRGFPDLARTMHYRLRSQWSSNRGAPFLVSRAAPPQYGKRPALVLRGVFVLCFLFAPQAPAQRVRAAWLSSGSPALSGPPLRARVRACGPSGRYALTRKEVLASVAQRPQGRTAARRRP